MVKGWNAAADRNAIVLSRHLLPLRLTPLQIEILRVYFPGWQSTRGLPHRLREWVAGWLRLHDRGDERLARNFLTARSERGSLHLRCFPPHRGAPAELHLTEHRHSKMAAPGLARLTRREREVLFWIAEGKRDGEIAGVLGIASPTVSKHVEHILDKLRAPNRLAAAALARSAKGWP